MPTFGWVREGDIERFLKGQPERPPADPQEFECPQCGKKFIQIQELRDHIGLYHPIELPKLYIFSKPLLRESVVRKHIGVDDIGLVQCTSCEIQVNGEAWRTITPNRLIKRFSQAKNAGWNIRLINERALDKAKTQEEYRIRFRIPDDRRLYEIDALFIEKLAIDEINHSELEAFQRCLPTDAPALEYAGGLGDLVIGILLKERNGLPRSPMNFDEFEAKMKSALDVLQHFDRPLANAVCNAVRFNLNDFQDHKVDSLSDIDKGLLFFRDIIEGGSLTRKRKRTVSTGEKPVKPAICPVDRISHRLLSACLQFVDGGILHPYDLEGLRQLKRGSSPISRQDMVKVDVLCAEGFLRTNRNEDARPHLQAIQFDPSFKDWSQRKMSEIS